MDILTIQGGEKLKGELVVSDPRTPRCRSSSRRFDGRSLRIGNVPHLDDIETVIALLVFLAEKGGSRRREVVVTAGPTLNAEAPYELVRKMRASIVVMARFWPGSAK